MDIASSNTPPLLDSVFVLLSTFLVQIHMQAANLDPTIFSSSSHPWISSIIVIAQENTALDWTFTRLKNASAPKGLSCTKFSQNSLKEKSLNCIVLGLFLFSVQDLLEAFSVLYFLRFQSCSILTQLRSASLANTSSGASSQNILFEPPSLAPPWCLQPDRCSGSARGFTIEQIQHMSRKKRDWWKYSV